MTGHNYLMLISEFILLFGICCNFFCFDGLFGMNVCHLTFMACFITFLWSVILILFDISDVTDESHREILAALSAKN